MDPIADLLIRIKNASLSNRKTVSVPHSKIKENLANVLKKEGFLEGIEVLEEKGKKQLLLTLSGQKDRPLTIEVKRISKPGRRVYVKSKDIKSQKRGLGTLIISSPEGLVTGNEAMKKKLGGEVVCKII